MISSGVRSSVGAVGSGRKRFAGQTTGSLGGPGSKTVIRTEGLKKC